MKRILLLAAGWCENKFTDLHESQHEGRRKLMLVSKHNHNGRDDLHTMHQELSGQIISAGANTCQPSAIKHFCLKFMQKLK